MRLVESLPTYASATATTTSARVQNYDGVLPLDAILELCASHGARVHIGHIGGEADLRTRGLSYAQTKSWKWRDPSTNRGAADRTNWIPGDRFIAIIGRLR